MFKKLLCVLLTLSVISGCSNREPEIIENKLERVVILVNQYENDVLCQKDNEGVFTGFEIEVINELMNRCNLEFELTDDITKEYDLMLSVGEPAEGSEEMYLLSETLVYQLSEDDYLPYCYAVNINNPFIEELVLKINNGILSLRNDGTMTALCHKYTDKQFELFISTEKEA